MQAHSKSFSNVINTDQGAREHFHVPKYQREYSWRKQNWEQLLQDIDENDSGYFMGSIISVKDSDRDVLGGELIYEVIDGQQRLTTLSLLMVAIYQRMKELGNHAEFEDDEDGREHQALLASIYGKLVKKKKCESAQIEHGGWKEGPKQYFLRVQPSTQNQNLEDYRYLLGEAGIIRGIDKPRYFGNRSICRAYRFFEEFLAEYDLESLGDYVRKINTLEFVVISVGSQADAFTLFETLNNRGVPLSAIDIIKNKMLSEMERQHKENIDDSYDRWQEIVAAIPESSDQERFLRHFYHAYKWDDAIRVDRIPRAIKSKLIVIYEQLIRSGAKDLFDRLCKAASTYGELIEPLEERFGDELCFKLRDLSRISASPAYQVLLYLFSRPASELETHDFLAKSVDLLCQYYVRRNVTDYPGTRDLDQAHMDLILACQSQITSHGSMSIDYFRNELFRKERCASTEKFRDALLGSMYSTNFLMTRYLLVKLDELAHTREYKPDLWARNDKGQYVWTIEHVLPQRSPMSAEWVEMIGDGDRKTADVALESHVHKLGNLTLSGYNSNLATAAFAKKQTLSQGRTFLGHRIDIGYKNGLALNRLPFEVDGRSESLASASGWTTKMIDARTEKMVSTILQMYNHD